jgi:hypothetical protein
MLVKIPKVDINLLHSEYVKNTKRGMDINAVFLNRMSLGLLSNSYVSVCSRVLRYYMGGNYRKYISSLEANGVIEVESNPYSYVNDMGKELHCKGTFSIRKSFAKRYRLTENYRDLIDYKITDEIIISKLDKII